MIRYISSGWSQIPKTVRIFFLKAFLLFILWKTIYLLFLLPGRVLDGPLTYSVGVLTTKTLNLLNPSQDFTVINAIDTFKAEGIVQYSQQMRIYLNKQRTLGIVDACNGLEILVLYAGFLICFPAPISRKIQFILVGFLLIYLINIIRCAALVLIYIHYNEYLDVSHHFIFTFIVYTFIFLLWYIFAKNLTLREKLAK